MNTYQLLLKLMRVVDRRDPRVPGLPLKYVLTLGGRHIGFFDPEHGPAQNAMVHRWSPSIAEAPLRHERFRRSWMQILADPDGGLIAVNSEGRRFVVDQDTGNVSPVT